jgi:hypothetical protein
MARDRRSGFFELTKATTVTSSRGRLEAIPLEETVEILEKYRVLDWDETLPPGPDGR